MSSATRLSLHYALVFGLTGVSLPFAGLWFASRGLSGAEIGILLAVPMLARLITGPMIAVWADGFARRRTPIAILIAVALVGYGISAFGRDLTVWLPAWFVAATASAAVIPLSDALGTRLARREGFGFALPRGFGSAAFVTANLCMGLLVARVGVDAIMIWIVVCAGLSCPIAVRVLPAEPVHESAGARDRGMSRFRGLGELIGDARFMTAILAVGCIQAAHGFYYAFSAIVWAGQGLATTTIGALWAFSVVVEIGFMWVVEPWRRRLGIGPWAVLFAGGIAAVVRWSILATMPGLAWLWPLQSLHALTFAATYLAGVQLVERTAPARLQTLGQTLNSTLAAGVLIGLATIWAGPLHDAHGASGYWAMSGLSALGLAIAAWACRRPRRPGAEAAEPDAGP